MSCYKGLCHGHAQLYYGKIKRSLGLTMNKKPKLSIFTLRPRWIGHHFAVFLNENVWIPIEISLKFVPKGLIIIKSKHWFRKWLGAHQATSHYLNQWWYSFLAHICITEPEWVKTANSDVFLNVCPKSSGNIVYPDPFAKCVKLPSATSCTAPLGREST